ncbi:hypothetical protein D3C83_304410 [compost metagenome]
MSPFDGAGGATPQLTFGRFRLVTVVSITKHTLREIPRLGRAASSVSWYVLHHWVP